MPNLPYSLSTDRSDVHRKSGAHLLVKLGRKLSQLNAERNRRHRRPGDTWVPDDLVEEITRIQNEISQHFQAHPRAKLRKYLLAVKSGGRKAKDIDIRACLVVGFLAAELLSGRTECRIMAVATACSLTGEPADILEMRRIIAHLCLDNVLATGTMDPAEMNPTVRLQHALGDVLVGGDECIPRIDAVSLAITEQDRLQRQTKASARKPKIGDGVAQFVAAIPVLRPRQLNARLEEEGYTGQRAARRTVCVSAFRHVLRLRRRYLGGEPFPDNLGREVVLLKGPTGCGKTCLAKWLFGGILGLPFALVDVTQLSEQGYVGGDTRNVLTSLIVSADGNPALAEVGTLILDEVDKLADAPDGRQQRVSRHGVQRELLRLLDGEEIDVPLQFGHPWKSPRVRIRSGRICIVACGAFSGWQDVVNAKATIGFKDSGSPTEVSGGLADEYQKYGLMPELIGRFQTVIAMDALGEDDLRRVLEGTVKRETASLKRDAIDLRVDDDARDLLVKRALARGTGARGVHASVSEAVQGALYEAYSGNCKRIRLRADGDSIAWEATRKRSRRDGKVTTEEIAELVSLPEGGEEGYAS